MTALHDTTTEELARIATELEVHGHADLASQLDQAASVAYADDAADPTVLETIAETATRLEREGHADLAEKLDRIGLELAADTERTASLPLHLPAQADEDVGKAYRSLVDFKSAFDRMHEIPQQYQAVYNLAMKAMDALGSARRDTTQLREVTRRLPRLSATARSAALELIANLIGRRVRDPYGAEGVIKKHEPHSAGMTNTLVHFEQHRYPQWSGKDVWVALHTLKPGDGKGPLVASAEVTASRPSVQAVKALEAKLGLGHRFELYPSQHGISIYFKDPSEKQTSALHDAAVKVRNYLNVPGLHPQLGTLQHSPDPDIGYHFDIQFDWNKVPHELLGSTVTAATPSREEQQKADHEIRQWASQHHLHVDGPKMEFGSMTWKLTGDNVTAHILSPSNRPNDYDWTWQLSADPQPARRHGRSQDIRMLLVDLGAAMKQSEAPTHGKKLTAPMEKALARGTKFPVKPDTGYGNILQLNKLASVTAAHTPDQFARAVLDAFKAAKVPTTLVSKDGGPSNRGGTYAKAVVELKLKSGNVQVEVFVRDEDGYARGHVQLTGGKHGMIASKQGQGTGENLLRLLLQDAVSHFRGQAG